MTRKFYEAVDPYEHGSNDTKPFPPTPKGKDISAMQEQEFIDRHLFKIMDMTADSFIKTNIEKMYGGLEMASVEHFLNTGRVSGSLYINLKKMMVQFARNWHTTAAKITVDNSNTKQ